MNMVNIICIVLLIALIVVLIICLVKNKDGFSGNSTEDFGDENDKVILCNRVGCGHGKKAEDLIKQNGMKIGDLHVEFATTEHPRCSGVSGTPTFFYKGNSAVGYHPDLKELEKKLKEPEKSKQDNTGGNNKIIMVGTEGCMFCKKSKALMDELNLSYEFVSPDSPSGKDLMVKHKANGVPLIIQEEKNIVITGFDKDKIGTLSN
jgi:glutaredoxin